MYKVFVNEKPIIITSSSQIDNNYPNYILQNTVIDEVIHKLRSGKINGVNLITEDLEVGWNYFKSQIEVVPAAGGLVKNAENQVLFIYRNNIWDLPKGKIEDGESIETAAIREVEEECGIFNLKLVKPLATTYHIYYQQGDKLKLTYWFLMISDFNQPLTPQIEEGITAVDFKNDDEIAVILPKSYANIKLVYDSYLES